MKEIKEKMAELHEMLENEANSRLQDLRNFIYSTLVALDEDVKIKRLNEEAENEGADENSKIVSEKESNPLDDLFS